MKKQVGWKEFGPKVSKKKLTKREKIIKLSKAGYSPDEIYSKMDCTIKFITRVIGVVKEPEVIKVPMKKCAHCGKLLPVYSFGKDKRAKSGYYSYCKICLKNRRKQVKT